MVCLSCQPPTTPAPVREDAELNLRRQQMSGKTWRLTRTFDTYDGFWRTRDDSSDGIQRKYYFPDSVMVLTLDFLRVKHVYSGIGRWHIERINQPTERDLSHIRVVEQWSAFASTVNGTRIGRSNLTVPSYLSYVSADSLILGGVGRHGPTFQLYRAEQ
jgi:hypothetical protein